MEVLHHNEEVDEDGIVKKIDIPKEEGLTFRKFWAFLGPGFLVSIAYLDPGNIESDLRTGTVAGYKLLWLLLVSTLLGAFLQRLALRLGVVTGKDLATNCHRFLPRIPNILTWIMVEIVIVASDMQEVIGTSIAFYILSQQKIPVYGGVLITMCDTFVFLLIDRYGFRKLEAIFAIGVLIMAVMFGYLYVISAPEQGQVMKGLFAPMCKNCNHKALLQAVGTIGAVIMPHNIYLHSSLTETRKIDRTRKSAIREANFLFLLECSIVLLVSFIINLFVVSAFSSAFYTAAEDSQSIYKMCMARNISKGNIFKNMTDASDMNIFSGSIFLGCKFGMATTYIWAVGIMAAGQTSTMTGTYTGQFVMQGFLNIKWKPWKRLVITRIIAIGPTIVIAVFQGLDKLTIFNDFLNILMSIQLPFALIPVIALTSSTYVMGPDFVNNRLSKILYTAVTLVIIAINIYLIVDIINHYVAGSLGYQILIIVVIVVYFAFMCYIMVCFLVISESVSPRKYSRFFIKQEEYVASKLEYSTDLQLVRDD